MNGYVEDQNLTKSFINESDEKILATKFNNETDEKKFNNETDEKILATKNFATCDEPLDMICLLHVKSLKKNAIALNIMPNRCLDRFRQQIVV